MSTAAQDARNQLNEAAANFEWDSLLWGWFALGAAAIYALLAIAEAVEKLVHQAAAAGTQGGDHD